MPFTLGVVWGVLCADVLQSLEYQIRPYEVEKGATQRAVERSVDYLYEAFKKRPHRGKKWGALVWHLSTNYFVNALREVKKNFDSIEVDRLQCRPVVKITGEFYLQTVEGDPNYNIHRWLESEGAEVYPAQIAVWLDYWMRFYVQILEDYRAVDRFAGAKIAAVKTLQRAFRWTYDRLRAALGDIPHELPDQYELRRLAAPYFHHRLSGGEGDMLVGKALWAHLNKKAHMICELSPYACLPNTMSVGAMAGVVGNHPDLLYAPIEVKGDAEIHALSRCQMILTEAKKRAVREYVEAMAADQSHARRRQETARCHAAHEAGDLSGFPVRARPESPPTCSCISLNRRSSGGPRENCRHGCRLHDRQGGRGRRRSRPVARLPAPRHETGREGARVSRPDAGRVRASARDGI